jgi:hypothetical protein
MDDVIDLCDRKGRFRRLVAAAVIGGAVTLALLHQIQGVAASPNPDAISQVSPVLLGMGMFVVLSTLALTAINAVRRRFTS